MAERRARRGEEIKALRRGIWLGMTLLDTAEMYAEGEAEALLGEAIRGFSREERFIVSKVYPHNAGKDRIFRSCENSLRRLGLDALDLYLLHWRGGVPLAETVACMEELAARGRIRRWGVSNFDADDMRELWSVPGGNRCAVNQVLYHLGSRGIEYELMPWHREHGVPVMAYCPLAQAGKLKTGMLQNGTLREVADKYHATPAQILLRFVLHDPLMVAIPKAGNPAHAEENAAAALEALSQEDYDALSDAFPAPGRRTPLDMR
jgi:diketogulonate reductase-like aldo/keto reductase